MDPHGVIELFVSLALSLGVVIFQSVKNLSLAKSVTTAI